MSHPIEPLEPRQLLAAGDLDTSFGNQGVVVLPDLPPASAVHVHPADGKIVAGAGKFIVRLNPDGSPDTSFGDNGRVDTGLESPHFDFLPDGRIVVFDTQIVTGGSWNWILARYNPDGSPDTSVDGDGRIVHPKMFNYALVMAAQPDGKILVATEGTKNMNDGGPPASAYVAARFNADGSLDTTFGDDGLATGHEGHRYGASVPVDIIVLEDGKFEVVGMESPHGGGGNSEAYSFDAAGNLTGPAHAYWEDSSFYTGAVRDDGQVVLVGTASHTSHDWVPGDPVAFAFINNKPHFLDFNPAGGNEGSPSTVLRAADNKVYIAGSESGAMGVIRLNPDGSPDESFGHGGTAYLRPKRFWSRMAAWDASLAPDGDVLAAGVISLKGAKHSFALARFQGGNDEPTETPPVAALRPLTLGYGGGTITPTAGQPRFEFEVLYAADDQIDPATLDDADILVIGPRGYRQRAKFESTFDTGLATQTGARYSIPAPGGSWSANDNGRYRILVRTRQVRDTHGAAVPATQIGAFRVKLASTSALARSLPTQPESEDILTAKRKDSKPIFLC